MRPRRPVLLLAALVAALLAPPAAAVQPIPLAADAVDHSAQTDAAGTLVVAYTDARQRRLSVCRLPAGGTACAAQVLFAVPADKPIDRVLDPVLELHRPTGRLVLLFRDGEDATRVTQSTDGGATWSPSVVAGPDIRLRDAELTPDGTAADLLGFQSKLMRVSLGGGPPSAVADLRDEASGLTRTLDGRLMTFGINDGDVTGRFLPAGASPGDASAWSPRRLLRKGYPWEPQADTGPTGTWLSAYAPTAGRVDVFRLEGERFVRPRTLGTLADRRGSNRLGPGRTLTGSRGLDVDPAGRVHVAIVRPGSFCGAAGCLQTTRTEPRRFVPFVPYAPWGEQLLSRRLQVVANEGGSGWVVWHTNPPWTLYATPLATPPRFARVGSVVLGGTRRATIPARSGCVRPGSRFVHRLDVTGRRGRARIASVRFFFDEGTLPRTDRRAPYRAAVTVPFGPGERHVAAARVRYRVAGGRLRTVTIGRAFVTCA